jgi:hypothetical protein
MKNTLYIGLIFAVVYATAEVLSVATTSTAGLSDATLESYEDDREMNQKDLYFDEPMLPTLFDFPPEPIQK